MTQHARMVKTLGSLVVAMTTLSVFLGWIDPSLSFPESVPSYESMLADARNIVTSNVAVPSDYWQAVTVVPGPANMPHRLIATANRLFAHFVVDTDGRLSRTAYWDRQEELAEASHEVTVAAARSTDGQPMTRAQWYAVRALVAAVAGVAATDGGTMPVHLHEDWARIYGVGPDESLILSAPRIHG